MTTRRNNTSATRNSQSNRSTKPANKPARQTAATPVPAKLEELEARLADKQKTLSEAKKAKQKATLAYGKAKEAEANQAYLVAYSHKRQGDATVQQLAVVASHDTAANTQWVFEMMAAKAAKDSEAVAKARELAKGEEFSLSSAIAEIKRNWSKCYSTLFGTIGIADKSAITPNLLKGLCPFLLVATADGLKAGTLRRSAKRSADGKAVKVNGQKVYKYTLTVTTKWSAYGLFELLELNNRAMQLFDAAALKERQGLLDGEVKALKALKAIKEAIASSNAEEAANAADRKAAVQSAAKAASQASKANLQEVGTEVKPKSTRKGGRTASKSKAA